MKKYSALILFLLVMRLSALMPGDTVPDFSFKELNFNQDATVDTLDRSIYSILDDGRTVIIYFFSITFS